MAPMMAEKMTDLLADARMNLVDRSRYDKPMKEIRRQWLGPADFFGVCPSMFYDYRPEKALWLS